MVLEPRAETVAGRVSVLTFTEWRSLKHLQVEHVAARQTTRTIESFATNSAALVHGRELFRSHVLVGALHVLRELLVVAIGLYLVAQIVEHDAYVQEYQHVNQRERDAVQNQDLHVMREGGEQNDGVSEELHHVHVLAALLPRAIAVQIPQVDRVLAEGLQRVHEQREALKGEQQQHSSPCVPEHGETEREPAQIGEQEQQLQRQHASVHRCRGIGRVGDELRGVVSARLSEGVGTYILKAIFGQEAEEVHESDNREPNSPDQEFFNTRFENSADKYDFK